MDSSAAFDKLSSLSSAESDPSFFKLTCGSRNAFEGHRNKVSDGQFTHRGSSKSGGFNTEQKSKDHDIISIDDDSTDVDAQDFEKAEVILNILLENPEEMNLGKKTTAVRENKAFTLDAREISIASAECDDNGAYIAKGSAQKQCFYGNDMCKVAHQRDGEWYVKSKKGKAYIDVQVNAESIFDLNRIYHFRKSNPTFSRTLVVGRMLEKEARP
eukprot:gene7892-13777_t